MRRYIIFFLAIATAMIAAAKTYKIEDIPNVHIENSTRYVSNPDGILSTATEAILDQRIANIWRQTTAEVVVVVVDDIDANYDIDSFATRLYEHWGIGKRDKSNGVLVLIAKDRRKAVIRTGYGAEGALTDILAGRILREQMFPKFKKGDYDGGTLDAVAEISRILTDPAYAADLRSRYANDAKEESAFDFFALYLKLSGACGLLALLYVMLVLLTSKKLPRKSRYSSLKRNNTLLLSLSFLTLGAVAPAWFILYRAMKRTRYAKYPCPNCNTPMERLSETDDNFHLTPVQDTEERINSVDYDVWKCPTCGELDIIPYINRNTTAKRCPCCGGLTSMLYSTRVITKPTTKTEGQGIKRYRCKHCSHMVDVPYTIEKLAEPIISAAAVAAIFSDSGGDGFSGGGGGISGGSFGGGFTGGGGASGGW